MELWIRSQNKKNLQIVQEIEYRDTGKEPRLVAENEIILGKYATKERALEILDEIQKDIIFGLKKVYEMPVD